MSHAVLPPSVNPPQPPSGRPTEVPGRPEPPTHPIVDRLWRLLLPVAVGLVLWFVPAPDGVKQQAWHLLAIFVDFINDDVGVLRSRFDALGTRPIKAETEQEAGKGQLRR